MRSGESSLRGRLKSRFPHLRLSKRYTQYVSNARLKVIDCEVLEAIVVGMKQGRSRTE